jgi:hypothetical protein
VQIYVLRLLNFVKQNQKAENVIKKPKERSSWEKQKVNANVIPKNNKPDSLPSFGGDSWAGFLPHISILDVQRENTILKVCF